MSGNIKFISNLPGVLALCLIHAILMLPAHAGNLAENWQQLLVETGAQYLAANSGESADFPVSSTRRYPPRQNGDYGNRGYADNRNSRQNGNSGAYDNRYTKGQYRDHEPIAEQKQYYGERRAPSSSGSQANRRYAEERETITEQRQYYNGKRPPYSSETQKNSDYSQGRETVEGQRQYSRGKRAPYSSEYQGNRKSSGGYSQPRQDNSLDDAISRVRRQSEGRVLSAETVRNNDREEHRVRIITDDGRVRRYRMDAHTGNILPRKR